MLPGSRLCKGIGLLPGQKDEEEEEQYVLINTKITAVFYNFTSNKRVVCKMKLNSVQCVYLVGSVWRSLCVSPCFGASGDIWRL